MRSSRKTAVGYEAFTRRLADGTHAVLYWLGIAVASSIPPHGPVIGRVSLSARGRCIGPGTTAAIGADSVAPWVPCFVDCAVVHEWPSIRRESFVGPPRLFAVLCNDGVNFLGQLMDRAGQIGIGLEFQFLCEEVVIGLRLLE